MRTSIAVAGAAAVLVALSILSVPAVASGAEYLAKASVSSQAETNSSASSVTATASRDEGLVPLITAWGVGGAVLLGGGALAVAASVRRQRIPSA